MFHFYTPWKRHKNKGFLTFSGCIKKWSIELKWINSMSLPSSINNCLLHTLLFSDESSHRCSTASEKNWKLRGWEKAFDGVTPYQNCTLQACDFIKQGSCSRLQISNFKSSSKRLILFAKPWKIFSKSLLTIFLKLLLSITKMTGKKNNTQTNANHNSNKQMCP